MPPLPSIAPLPPRRRRAGRAPCSALDTSGGGSGVLKWGLYCHGDYNQDGVVGIADLAPLGQRFGEVSPGGLGVPWPAETSGAVLDGSWDGSINIPDVAPIGQNWGRRVAGYRVYRSHDPADVPQVAADLNGASAELVADVALADAIVEPGMRKRFELALAEDAAGWFFWVRPYDGAEEGTPSNSVPRNGRGQPGAHRRAGRRAVLRPRAAQRAAPAASRACDLDGLIVGLRVGLRRRRWAARSGSSTRRAWAGCSTSTTRRGTTCRAARDGQRGRAGTGLRAGEGARRPTRRWRASAWTPERGRRCCTWSSTRARALTPTAPSRSTSGTGTATACTTTTAGRRRRRTSTTTTRGRSRRRCA